MTVHQHSGEVRLGWHVHQDSRDTKNTTSLSRPVSSYFFFTMESNPLNEAAPESQSHGFPSSANHYGNLLNPAVRQREVKLTQWIPAWIQGKQFCKGWWQSLGGRRPAHPPANTSPQSSAHALEASSCLLGSGHGVSVQCSLGVGNVVLLILVQPWPRLGSVRLPNPNMNFLGRWTRKSPRPFLSLKYDSLTKCSFVKVWTVLQFHYRVPHSECHSWSIWT